MRPHLSPPGSKIRVLIVDDSAIVRRILANAVATESDMEVVGAAPDAYIAREMILALRPDVITLDLEMPRMDGITFLKRLMRETPIPVIVISALDQASCAAAIDALRCGAVDVIAKPAGPYSVGDLRLSLAAKIRAAAGARPHPALDFSRTLLGGAVSPAAAVLPGQPALNAVPPARAASTIANSSASRQSVIAIGASTGGIVAIQEVLLRLPADMPPIVITQHIPAGFSRAFADRLNKVCAMEVREAVHGDILRRGLALLAPGDYHLELHRAGPACAVHLHQGPEVCYLRPSVDVMFLSVAEAFGSAAVGVLLTGMGVDGARGMAALKRAGAATIAQNEATCVVYGMPREAVRLGAVDTIAPLTGIAALLTRLTRRQRQPAEPIMSEA